MACVCLCGCGVGRGWEEWLGKGGRRGERSVNSKKITLRVDVLFCSRTFGYYPAFDKDRE